MEHVCALGVLLDLWIGFIFRGGGGGCIDVSRRRRRHHILCRDCCRLPFLGSRRPGSGVFLLISINVDSLFPLFRTIDLATYRRVRSEKTIRTRFAESPRPPEPRRSRECATPVRHRGKFVILNGTLRAWPRTGPRRGWGGGGIGIISGIIIGSGAFVIIAHYRCNSRYSVE
jgi:hypothetical protein